MGKIISNVFILNLFLLTGCLKDADLLGVIYTGQSVDKRVEQSLEYNEIHGFRELSTSNNDYVLYVMGDSHLGESDNFIHFLNQAKINEALAVAFCGDLVTGHEKDYEVFYNLLQQLDTIPYFPMAGNHDLYFEGWKHYLHYFGTSTYYFTVQTPVGTDLFICLDSGSGTLGGAQLTWLENLLNKDRNNFRYCALFTHHNIFRNTFDTAASPNLEENYRFIDLMTKFDVQFVIQGHSHKRSVDKFGNTTYVVMDALKFGDANAGYLKLNVAANDITHELIYLP